MSDTEVTITGNLTREPELRYTQGGTAAANFSIACNRRVKNAAGEWVDGETSFFQVVCFRELAENVAASLVKGSRAVVSGTLVVEEYDRKDGAGKGVAVKVIADDVAASLKFATATLERTHKGQGGGGGRSRSTEEPPY